MLRHVAGALLIVALSAGSLLAKEIKGTLFEIVSADKGFLLILDPVKDEITRFNIPESAKVVDANDKEIKERFKSPLFKKGVEIILTREEKDGKEVTTKVKLGVKQK